MARKAKAPKTIEHLKDLHADPMNARKHGERNIGMLSKSLARRFIWELHT